MASTGWSGAAASPNEIPKMTSGNQVTILDSTFDRDGPKVIFGIEPSIRRIFEFAAAATVVILLGPIFLATAIAIKLNSRGPIFVREPQLGSSNRVIEVRAQPTPALFNVLRGEMSLIDLLRAIGRDGVLLP
jgi:lipopolysaccharide/colanic/teichoic acid biosynthesis glycosyltransferase